MEKDTKKIITWLGLSIVGLFILSVAIGYTVLVCHESGEIGQYSPFCYICVSSAVRGVPFVGLDEKPIYYVNGEYQDGNKIQAASSSVEYSSNQSPDEIIKESTIYFNSIAYKREKLGCEDESKCPNCCIWFIREESRVSVLVHHKTVLNGYNLAETNLVRVNETFQLRYKYEGQKGYYQLL